MSDKTTRGGVVRCGLCPKECRIPTGFSGECRIRVNTDGRLHATTYGHPCAVHVDPMEKKPLFHFLPGSRILSIGTAGCNLRCKHCQNAEISQANPEDTPSYALMPEEVPALARRHNCVSVAYTYTEPVVSYEYTMECCQAARAAGLRNVLVTAAYINAAPLQALLPYVDAANVDIKAMNDDFYRTVCSGTLEPVLRNIVLMREAGLHLEITNLVIPTLNDGDEMLSELCQWVARYVGVETPLHFSRFFPCFQMRHLAPTPEATLRRARQTALDYGLQNVFVGNIEIEGGEDTVCVQCGALLIKRRRYVIVENRLQRGACPQCSANAHGVWS